MQTIFHYKYRDAGNFKSFGSVVLDGCLSEAEKDAIIRKFDMDDLFVAEQIGIPPLYEPLYVFSDGPISLDHAWHEFSCFEEVESVASPQPSWGNAKAFYERILSVDDWNMRLSPNCAL